MDVVVFVVGERMSLLLIRPSWRRIGFVDNVRVYSEINGEHLLVIYSGYLDIDLVLQCIAASDIEFVGL
jgi:hypothetical protein